MNEYNAQQLPELLQGYYRFLFPHKLFYRWLSYGNLEKWYFERREFSFCLSGDIYVRYKSFDDANEMEKTIVSKLPEKIDIGAVYNMKPRDHKNVGIVPFKAEDRELVFDIDMTDYDDVRTCCRGADICPKCWPFMVIAAKILNRALRDDFGFKHLLWVYSGRRGIHCWVCDERARKLSIDARSAVAEYLTVIEGGEFKAKKVNFDGHHQHHPFIESSLSFVNDYFESLILDKQKLLETKEQIKRVIDLCPDRDLKQQLETQMYRKDLKNSVDRWNTFEEICKNYYKSVHKSVTSNTKLKFRHFIDELKLQFCYPRLDINVTKGLNHLLKTPFSVHPKTGRICVPIDFKSIDTFDPFSVPTVNLLCAQIDQKSNSGEDKRRIYEKTDLFKSIKILEDFIKNLEQSFRGERIKRSDVKIEF